MSHFRARFSNGELQSTYRYDSKPIAAEEQRKRYEKQDLEAFSKAGIHIIIEEVRPSEITDFVNPESLLSAMRERMSEVVGDDSCLDFELDSVMVEDPESGVMVPSGEQVQGDKARLAANLFNELVTEAVKIWAEEYNIVPVGDIVLHTWTERAAHGEAPKPSLDEMLADDSAS